MSMLQFPTAGGNVVGEKVGDALKKIFTDEELSELSDVELRGTDGNTVKANKMILMVRSSYFRSMFLGGFAERDASAIDLGYTSKVLSAVVRFLYTDKLDLSLAGINFKASPKDWEGICSTLVAAAAAGDYLDCQRLQTTAESKILDVVKEGGTHAAHLVLQDILAHGAAFSLSKSHIAACRVLADEIIGVTVKPVNNCGQCFEECGCWFRYSGCGDWSPHMNGKEWDKILDVSPAVLESVVPFADPDIEWDQEMMFRFIIEWMGRSPNDRRQSAQRACGKLNLSKMCVKFLSDEVAASDLVPAATLAVALDKASGERLTSSSVLVVREAGTEEVNGMYRACGKTCHDNTVYKMDGVWRGEEVDFFVYNYIIDRQGVDAWAFACLPRGKLTNGLESVDSRDWYLDIDDAVPHFYFSPYTHSDSNISTTTQRWVDSDPHTRYDEGGDGNGDEYRRTKEKNPSNEALHWLDPAPKPAGESPGPVVVMYKQLCVCENAKLASPQKTKGRME